MSAMCQKRTLGHHDQLGMCCLVMGQLMRGGFPFLDFVVFGREFNRPSREERAQFPSGRLDAEMFRNMRLAHPPHRRCEAAGALESVSRRGASDPCLPIAKAELFDQVQALDGFIVLEYDLNERMFFGLWPGCRVHR